MKLATLTLGLLLCIAAQSQEPTMVGKHRLGETIQEWLTITGIDPAATCGGRNLTITTTQLCEGINKAQLGKTSGIERDDRQWTFADGKLGVISILKLLSGNLSEEMEFLTNKYGKPTDQKSVPYQNAFGAKWECAEATWKMPDGATILAQESVKSTNGRLTRWLTVNFLSKEYIDKYIAQRAAKPNPYDK